MSAPSADAACVETPFAAPLPGREALQERVKLDGIFRCTSTPRPLHPFR